MFLAFLKFVKFGCFNIYCFCLIKQVRARDDEIDRLTGLLEGGRPVMAVNKDCCCCCYCRPSTSLDYQLIDKNRILKDQLIGNFS